MKKVANLVELDKKLAKLLRGGVNPLELPEMLTEFKNARFAMTKEQLTITSTKILEN